MPKEQADQRVLQEAVVQTARSLGKEGNLIMGADGNLTLADDEQLGSSCDRYSWGQNENEVTVTFRVAAGTKGKDVCMVAKSKSIKMAVRGEVLLEGPLHAAIVPDDCTYTLEDAGDGRLMTLVLTKASKTAARTHWPSVVPGEAVIVRFPPPHHPHGERSADRSRLPWRRRRTRARSGRASRASTRRTGRGSRRCERAACWTTEGGRTTSNLRHEVDKRDELDQKHTTLGEARESMRDISPP